MLGNGRKARTRETSGTGPIAAKSLPPASRANNFDLLRLLAALQVACYHGVRILDVPIPDGWVGRLWQLGNLFPGVPIFFCISGFLIAQSLERNRSRLSKYFEARVLRIYPALVAVTCLGAMMLLLLGFFKGVPLWKCAIWFCTTVTAGSTINPDFLRGFGIGVWNGSLWTIPVELSFYGFLPVACLLFDSRKRLLNSLLALGLITSYVLFLASGGLTWGDTKSVGVVSKVVWFSLPGNLWMFLFGTLAHRCFARSKKILEGKFFLWFLLMVLVGCVPHSRWPFWANASHLFFSRLLLAGMTLSAAYSAPKVSERLLHGQDLSYGLYLYHAPLFNLFYHFGLRGNRVWCLLALGLAFVAAALSWIVVEKPALAMKGKFFTRVADFRQRLMAAARGAGIVAGRKL
jgi:peptidoglycan/LPS O-acetylase OafA/YrhL